MPVDPILGPQGDPATPAPAQPTGGVTLEQVSQIVRDGITASQESLTKALDTRFGQLADTLRQSAPQPKPPETPDDDEFLKEFAASPREVLRRVVSETVSPTVNQLTTSAGRAFVDLEAQAVDTKWGAGAWDKYVAPHWSKLEAAYQRSNPALLSDRSLIAREVYSIVGMQTDELLSHREAHQKAEAERQTKDVDNLVQTVSKRVNLTGGLRPTGGSESELPPDAVQSISSYIDRRTRAIGGQAEDPKAWYKRIGSFEGETIDEWQAHQESLKPSKGAN